MHECLRGAQSSGEIIEVIDPNSSVRILMEEGTHITMLKRSFVYKEEQNVIASSKKEILCLIETHYPDIYNYAFDGLKLNARHLDTIQTSIQSQPQPLQKKYTTICYEDVPITLHELDKKATHIVLAKERVPHITHQEKTTHLSPPKSLTTGPPLYRNIKYSLI